MTGFDLQGDRVSIWRSDGALFDETHPSREVDLLSVRQPDEARVFMCICGVGGGYRGIPAVVGYCNREKRSSSAILKEAEMVCIHLLCVSHIVPEPFVDSNNAAKWVKNWISRVSIRAAGGWTRNVRRRCPLAAWTLCGTMSRIQAMHWANYIIDSGGDNSSASSGQ